MSRPKNLIQVRESNRRYYEKNREVLLSRNREWKRKNKKRHLYTNSIWAAANRERVRNAQRRYQTKNTKSHRANTVRYRLALINRIPKWADLSTIKAFYQNCPAGMTVDHIIPLQGERVSGLHVICNLQYLTLSENSAKRNKYIVD